MDARAAEIFEQLLRDDRRYPRDAYAFLSEGLQFTSQLVHGKPSDSAEETPRHVSGQQLCEGLRQLAVQRWGRLAGLVLRRWGLRTTRDFGEMVFRLVERGLLGKQEADRVEDFDDVYDFDDAFGSYDIPTERSDA